MRQIYIVNATQVVVSESHPEGLYSVLSGFPRTFDSMNYNATEQNPDGDPEKALRVAKSSFHDQQSKFEASDTRAMWTMTLVCADGTQFMSESWGKIPSMNHQPEPEFQTEQTGIAE